MVSTILHFEVKRKVWIRPFLITAILIFILTQTLLWNDSGSSQQRVFELIKHTPNWLAFLLIAGVAPVLEEGVFRYGVRLQKVGFYIYLLGILAFASLGAKSWVISLALLLFAGVVVYSKAKGKNYINLLIIFSSLAFGLAHISNSGDVTFFTKIVYVVNIFSIGIILMLMRLRWGLFCSILAHSSWNFLGVLMLFLGAPDSIRYQSNDINIHLEKDAVFSNKDLIINKASDTLSMKHVALSYIVKRYFDEENLKLSVKSSDVANYSGYIITQKNMLAELTKQLGFCLDTVTQSTKHYVISDSLQEGFFPIRSKEDYVDKSYKHVLVDFKVRNIIESMAWDDNARVHINFTDSILDTKFDNFEYHSGYDFIGKMEILSNQLGKHWYYNVYEEEEDVYVLKEQDI